MVKKKKCPFRKDTYIKNTNVFNGCPMEQKVSEDFSDCIKEECALWSEIHNICGLVYSFSPLNE